MGQSSRIYDDLKIGIHEIRLLKLLAGGNGPLCAELQVVSTDQLPQYEALSYVWGNSQETRSIRLGNNRFDVTVNLYAALWHLRRRGEDRLLWIDAICVNQKDVVEWNSQVALMSQIYQGCEQCIAWLGKDSGLMEDAIELIRSMATGCHIWEWPCFTIAGLPCTNLEQFAILTKDKPRFLEPLQDLIDNPWWTRIWTLQESVLPRKLLFKCGAFEIDWRVFEETMQGSKPRHIWDCCDEAFYMLSSLDQGVINDYNEQIGNILFSRTSNNTPLLVLAQRCRARGATDPKDKIFALIGISSQDTLSPVKALYNIPVVDVYENFAIDHIQLHGNLFILCLAGLNVSITGLPSWVPDWSMQISPVDVARLSSRLVRYDLYSASSKVRANSIEHVSRSLKLDGAYIGRIIQYGQVMPDISDIWLSETRYARVQSVILDWLAMVKAAYPVLNAEADRLLLKMFMETLLTGCSFNNDHPGTAKAQRLSEDDDQILLATLQSFTEPSRLTESEHSPEILRRIDDFKVGMLRVLRGSRMFITESKRIGLVSWFADIGDEAWVLQGGWVPFLLRRQNPESSSEYKLVCDCFVQGCMDGELADELQRNPTRIQIL